MALVVIIYKIHMTGKIYFIVAVFNLMLHDIDQKSGLKLFSNNQITSVQHDELYNIQQIVNDVEVVVGSEDKSLKVLNKVINESKDYSLSVIERTFRNMNEINTSNNQTVVIKSLRPLRCKNKCHEKPTAGRVNQYINLDIAVENIIRYNRKNFRLKINDNTSSVSTKLLILKTISFFWFYCFNYSNDLYNFYVIFHILYIV